VVDFNICGHQMMIEFIFDVPAEPVNKINDHQIID